MATLRVELSTNFGVDQDGDADGDGESESHYIETEQSEFLETKYEVLDGSYIWTDTGFTADHDFQYSETASTTFTRIHLSGEYVDLFGTPIDQAKLNAPVYYRIYYR